MKDEELDQLLERVGAIDLLSSDYNWERQQLAKLLWSCGRVRVRVERRLIVEALPEEIQRTLERDEHNDMTDIELIVVSCLDQPDGLKLLIKSVAAREGRSIPFHKVCLFLLSLDRMYNGAQIRRLRALLTGMKVENALLAELYRFSTPFSSDDYWQYPRRLENQDQIIAWVLDRLNKAPVLQQGRGIPALLAFVERMATRTEDKAAQTRLRTWVEQDGVRAWQVEMETVMTFRQQVEEEAAPPIPAAEAFSPSLMIELGELDEQRMIEPEALDEQSLERFEVKAAWLKYGPEETACVQLEVPEEYKTCDQNTILELLDKHLLDELGDHKTIEFFLPRALFHLKVDEWKMPSEQPGEADAAGKTLGEFHRVIIRSSERFVRPISRAKEIWKENWERIKHLQPEEDVIKWLSTMQEYNGESLYSMLVDEKKVVLWLLVPPFTVDPKDKRQVFYYMLRAGIPVALWLKEPAGWLKEAVNNPEKEPTFRR